MDIQARTFRVRTMIEKLIWTAVTEDYKYNGSGVILMELQKGLEKLPKLFGISEIDDERVVDYIVYQIYRSREAIKDGKWRQSWMFSSLALAKYHQQFLSADGKSGMNYYINLWLEKAELSRSSLAAMIAKPKSNPLKQMIYIESEESIKRRFLNTNVGLSHCQQSTTGWSPLSKCCSNCKYWMDCGQLTSKKYPELMRLRKEVYGKQKK